MSEISDKSDVGARKKEHTHPLKGNRNKGNMFNRESTFLTSKLHQWNTVQQVSHMHSPRKSPHLCHQQSKCHTGLTHNPQVHQDRKMTSPHTPSPLNNKREMLQEV